MRTFFLLSVILFVSACKSSTVSISGKQEKAFIANFLNDMKESNLELKRPLHHYIDREFINANGLSNDGFYVDAFTVDGYKVESYSEGTVIALVWGEDKAWMHRLHFKLSKEKGQLYIVPSLYEDEFVTPWWTSERDVEQ